MRDHSLAIWCLPWSTFHDDALKWRLSLDLFSSGVYRRFDHVGHFTFNEVSAERYLS
jgi:hypothetical protein